MELENLKTIWRSVEDHRGAGESQPVRERGKEEIQALLTRRSRGPVAKMKRNLLGELILVLVIYIPAILFYFFGFGGRLWEMGWVLLALLAFFGGYCYRKNRLLNEMQIVSYAVRSNIERQLVMLRSYTRSYAVVATTLLPVMAVVSFFVTEWKLPVLAGGSWRSELWVWVLALGLVTVGNYFVNTRYVNRLYGRHIGRLEGLLREMDEDGGGPDEREAWGSER